MPRKIRDGTCQQCGQGFTSRTSRLFCGDACYHLSRKTTTERKCKNCGVTFYKKNQGHHGVPVYCGMECQKLGRTKLVQLACELCGAKFKRKPTHVSRARFCSRACHYRSKTDLRSITCLKCERIFKVRKGRQETAKFCSRLCKSRYTITGETKIEKMVRLALESLAIPFYQEFPAGNRYSVDFFLPQQRIALEVDGEYWHNRPLDILKDARRDTYLRKKGIETVRIKSVELFSHPSVQQLVLEKLSM